MNILMTLSQLEVTGAEVYAVSIADNLVEKGHNVFVISDTLTKQTKAKYISLQLSRRTLSYRIKNVYSLVRFIRTNNIQIVHAHSRASAWVSNIACRIAGIPLVTTVHGRQSTFLSRKLVKGFGDYTLAICEAIKTQLINKLNVPANKIEVLRNGFDLSSIQHAPEKKSNEKVITLITRLSGPKGDLAFQLLESLEDISSTYNNISIRVVGGRELPERFRKFSEKFEFTGYVENLPEYINTSDVIIGTGRIAIESILHGKPTIAIGEACSIGLITPENLDFALETNFGDMAEYEKVFDFKKIIDDIAPALKLSSCSSAVINRVREEYDLKAIVERIEYIYQSLIVRYYKKEVPVIMYHRVVRDISEAGRHGIYVTEEQFESHMKYLKQRGYQTLTFEEAVNLNRLDRNKKYIIITFDDGYTDNYKLAFPILKKYGFKAVIFLVAGLDYNKWDCTSPDEPRLGFMNKEQLLEMQHYGIEFGVHTMTHPDLTKLSCEEAQKEIFQSRDILEEKLGKKLKTFAYPYGALNEETKVLLKQAGFSYGIATDTGPLGLHEDLFQIRRIGIFPNTNASGFARKVKGNYSFRRVKDESLKNNIPAMKRF